MKYFLLWKTKHYVVKKKIAIKNKERIKKNKQIYDSLYEDYRMKDRYINALRVVDNFIEGEKCSFQPKINKHYKDNYYYNGNDNHNDNNYYYKDDDYVYNKNNNNINHYHHKHNYSFSHGSSPYVLQNNYSTSPRPYQQRLYSPVHNNNSSLPLAIQKYKPSYKRTIDDGISYDSGYNRLQYNNNSNSNNNIHHPQSRSEKHLSTVLYDLYKSATINNTSRLYKNNMRGNNNNYKYNQYPYTNNNSNRDINTNNNTHTNINQQGFSMSSNKSSTIHTNRENSFNRNNNNNNNSNNNNNYNSTTGFYTQRLSGNHQNKISLNSIGVPSRTNQFNHKDEYNTQNIPNVMRSNNNNNKLIKNSSCSNIYKNDNLLRIDDSIKMYSGINSKDKVKHSSSSHSRSPLRIDNNNNNNNKRTNKTKSSPKHLNEIKEDNISVSNAMFSVMPAYSQVTHVTLQSLSDGKIQEIANHYVGTDESLERFKYNLKK